MATHLDYRPFMSPEPESHILRLLRVMRAEIGNMRSDFVDLRGELRSDIHSLRADVAADLLAMEARQARRTKTDP